MSIDPRFSVLVDGYTYFECPRWHEDRLWLSDFYTGQVIRVALDGQVERMADVPQQPSGISTTWWWTRRAAPTWATSAST